MVKIQEPVNKDSNSGLAYVRFGKEYMNIPLDWFIFMFL